MLIMSEASAIPYVWCVSYFVDLVDLWATSKHKHVHVKFGYTQRNTPSGPSDPGVSHPLSSQL